MQIQLKPYFAFCAEFETVLRRLFEAADGMSEASLLLAITTLTARPPADVLSDMEERYRLIERRAGDQARFQLTSANRMHLAHVLEMDDLQSPGVTVEIVRDISRRMDLLPDLIPHQAGDSIDEMRVIERRLDELREATRRLHGAIFREAHRLRTDEVPTQRRYHAIAELWDHHILPLYGHVQPDGEIEKTLTSAIAHLTHIIDDLPDGSELHEVCHHLRACAGRARREALDRFNAAHAEVLPLHQARRRHLLVEQGVEILVERIRRHGVGPRGVDFEQLLPLTAFRFGTLFEDDDITEALASVLEHRPRDPEPITTPSVAAAPPFNRLAAQQRIQRRLPITDLLQAAIDETPGRPLADTLGIYARIIGDTAHSITYGDRRRYEHSDNPLEAPVVRVDLADADRTTA